MRRYFVSFVEMSCPALCTRLGFKVQTQLLARGQWGVPELAHGGHLVVGVATPGAVSSGQTAPDVRCRPHSHLCWRLTCNLHSLSRTYLPGPATIRLNTEHPMRLLVIPFIRGLFNYLLFSSYLFPADLFLALVPWERSNVTTAKFRLSRLLPRGVAFPWEVSIRPHRS